MTTTPIIIAMVASVVVAGAMLLIGRRQPTHTGVPYRTQRKKTSAAAHRGGARGVWSVLLQNLPSRMRFTAVIALALPLVVTMFFLGSRAFKEFGSVIEQGNMSSALRLALTAFLFMAGGLGVNEWLSNFLWGQCAQACANLYEVLYNLHFRSSPMAVSPRKAEGGLSSRPTDLEQAWIGGARPLILAGGNMLALTVAVVYLDSWAGSAIAVGTLAVAVTVELTLGKQRVISLKLGYDQRSALHRVGRFWARPRGQRIGAGRDPIYEVNRVMPYVRERTRLTHREARYTALGNWLFQVNGWLVALGGPLLYVVHQKYLHRPINVGMVLILVVIVSLFQSALTQGAQGLTALRKGEPAMEHVLLLQGRADEVAELEARRARLQEEAQKLAQAGGRIIVPPQPITAVDVQIINPHGDGTQSEVVMAVPHLRIEPGSIVGFVGPSGSGKSPLLALLSGNLHPNTDEHLPGGLRYEGQVLYGGATSGSFLSAILIEAAGHGLAVAEASQGDTIRSYVMSAQAEATDIDLTEALRNVGLWDALKNRLDVPLSTNPLTAAQRLLLTLAQVSLVPTWHRSVIAFDQSFSIKGLDANTMKAIVKALKKFNSEGSTILIGEETKEKMPGGLSLTACYECRRGQGLHPLP
jgi:ABC-type multidrug transport system fused ATPase/permease subunit